MRFFRQFFGYLSLLIVVCFTHAHSQTSSSSPITINQAVQEALEKNLGLLAERYNLSIADARIITAKQRPNPALSVGGDHLDLLGTGFRDINGAGPLEYSIRTDFIFERGEKRHHRIEVAEQAKQVAQMQLLTAMRALVLDVQNAFVDVLLAQEGLKLAQDNLTTFNKIVQVNVERVRVGDLAQVELTRTQLAELQFNNAVIQAVTKLRITQQRLQLLMGRAVPSPSFDVSGQMRREPLPFSPEELQQQAMARRPDYQAMLRDQARSVAASVIERKIACTEAGFSASPKTSRRRSV